jgi:hypothetical protein
MRALMASPTQSDGPTVEVRNAGQIRPLEGELLGKPLREWRRLTARELQLPDDLLVGTGHQAQLWHPGILAKFVWAHERAQRAQASFVHLLVDTDTRDPLAFRAPVRAPSVDAGAAARHEVLRDASQSFGAPAPAAMAACAYPARAPSAFELRSGHFALPCVEEGVRRTHAALAAHAAASDGAAQAWAALQSLVTEALHGAPEGGAWLSAAPWARTQQLLRTSIGSALIQRALQDPDACARAFNLGAHTVARAARPLGTVEGQGVEMPFWLLSEGGMRMRVGARALPALLKSGATLLPRAFLTSAIARAALCDRFVHGTGGGIYERATETFMGEWLGARLPPFDMATATVVLPFPSQPAGALVTHAVRRHAWFDPHAAFGERSHQQQRASAGVLSDQKRSLLAAVNQEPRKSSARKQAWRAMHAELARTRAQLGTQLAELSAREEADRQHAREAQIRADRTWPVPLHPAASITTMAALLRQSPSDHA